MIDNDEILNDKYVRIVDDEVFGAEYNFEPLKGGMGQFVYNACQKYQDNICQVHVESDSSETYKSFSERSVKLAVFFAKNGIQTGDIMTLCSPNTLDNAIPITASLYVGAVFSSLDPSLSAREATFLLGLVQPKAICIHYKSINLIEDYCNNTSNKPLIIIIGDDTTSYTSLSNILDTESNDETSQFKPVFIDDPNSTCCILFSSGTTGLAKGICIPHITLYNGSMSYLNFMDNPTTLYHGSTFYWISAVLSYGAQFCNGSSRVNNTYFDADKFPEIIEKYKISMAFMPSLFAYYLDELKSLKEHDLSLFKVLVLAGSFLSTKQMNKVKSLLPKIHVFAGYGMTELGNFATFFHSRNKALADEFSNSVGYPIYNARIKVLDIETNKKLGPNQSGELRIKIPTLMSGYYKQDSSNGFDEEGYIITGDVGYYNEKGLFYVIDRIKDMFKHQMWHIIPADIESVIKEHPDILGAVVFGFPNEKDELPAAGIKLRPGSKTTANDIQDFVAERVLDRQKLKGGVYILEEIPLTASNKVNRRAVREKLINQSK